VIALELGLMRTTKIEVESRSFKATRGVSNDGRAQAVPRLWNPGRCSSHDPQRVDRLCHFPTLKEGSIS